MESSADVLLAQEHRLDGPGLPGMQAAAMGKVWHGIWGPALANGNGPLRFWRGPTPIARGGTLARGTIGVVSWVRRTRLRIASVHDAQAADPGQAGVTAHLLGEWQEYLAGLGNAPWILGGDWNLEPDEVTDHWYRSETALIGIYTATPKLGRNIDWYLGSRRVPVDEVEAEVVSGAWTTSGCSSPWLRRQ